MHNVQPEGFRAYALTYQVHDAGSTLQHIATGLRNALPPAQELKAVIFTFDWVVVKSTFRPGYTSEQGSIAARDTVSAEIIMVCPNRSSIGHPAQQKAFDVYCLPCTSRNRLQEGRDCKFPDAHMKRAHIHMKVL
jgi:hypothetical protein